MYDTLCVPSQIGPYKFRGDVGEGAFSVVKLVHVEETDEYFACKIIPRSRLLIHNLDSRFENEIRVNQQIHHPGVVVLYDLLKDEFNYYIIMEFCAHGELFQYVVSRSRLDESEAKVFFKQILEALNYVHSLGICHRDLKPENILLDEIGRIKISDFGLAKFVGPNGLVTTPCGSPCYASPECVSGRPYDGCKSDIWSCGVILYAMLTGKLPWTKRNQQQLFEQIRRGDYTIPNYLTAECRSFLQSLMTVDANMRISIPDALQHPWLLNVRFPVDINEVVLPTPSLRRIDQFFEREIEIEEMDLEKSESDKSYPIDSVKRAITPKKRIPFRSNSVGPQRIVRKVVSGFIPTL